MMHGDELIALREAAGMSQAAFAAHLGIWQTTLATWERNRVPANWEPRVRSALQELAEHRERSTP